MSETLDLDGTDRAVRRTRQDDARTPFSEIARRIEMSGATVHGRVSRLQEGDHRSDHAEVNRDGTRRLGVVSLSSR